jgi:hypothetical protein
MKTRTFLLLLVVVVVASNCKKEAEVTPSYSNTSKSSTAAKATSLSTAQLTFPTPDITLSKLVTGVYTIHPRVNPDLISRWLSVPGSSGDHTIVRCDKFYTTMAEKWRVTNLGTGYYAIVNLSTGKSLDIPGGLAVPGVKIQQYTYHGGLNQQWRIAYSVSKGIYWITNRQTLLAVEAPLSSPEVVQNTPNNSDNQTWYFYPWDTIF